MEVFVWTFSVLSGRPLWQSPKFSFRSARYSATRIPMTPWCRKSRKSTRRIGQSTRVWRKSGLTNLRCRYSHPPLCSESESCMGKRKRIPNGFAERWRDLNVIKDENLWTLAHCGRWTAITFYIHSKLIQMVASFLFIFSLSSIVYNILSASASSRDRGWHNLLTSLYN